MAGQARQQNDDMQRRLIQQQRLQEYRQGILLQPKEKCPRCDSMDTKFAYFNNQKETQPRYLCHSCKRLWTKGGKQRNIPVGGAVRPLRALSLGGGLVMTPGTSPSFLVDSAGRYHITGGAHSQPPFNNNIQPQQNGVSNSPNSFTAALRTLNPGSSLLQPPVGTNIQPPQNVVQNLPNLFRAAGWQAPNPGLSQLQPPVHNNVQPPPNSFTAASRNPNPGSSQRHSSVHTNAVPNLPNSFRAAPPNQGPEQLQPFVGNNIQPSVNNFVPNPFGAAQHARNQGPTQLHPSVANNIHQMGGAGGSFSARPSFIDWSTLFSDPVEEPYIP